MRRLVILLALLALPLSAAPEYPKMGPDVYDTKADGKAQVAAALARASAGDKRVLVVFGANWCIWCRRLHDFFQQDAVVEIDVNTRNGTARNADLDARYGHPTKQGLPVIVVLDATGKQLTTQETGALEEGAAHSAAKVVPFLERWKAKK
jgi:thiol:disulfide interchange protein